jgi:hypothetical protein
MNQVVVSAHHKTHHLLHQELLAAKELVTIGGIYAHYKHPENTYRVINLGFDEATDKICVIYQATYDQELFFIRPLDSWMQTIEVGSNTVARFLRVE